MQLCADLDIAEHQRWMRRCTQRRVLKCGMSIEPVSIMVDLAGRVGVDDAAITDPVSYTLPKLPNKKKADF